MDYEDIKTIAAFSGFLLGLANLSVTVYEKFIRKGAFAVEVNKAVVRYLEPCQYVAQIEISIHSKGVKNWVKHLTIANKYRVIEKRDRFSPYCSRVECDMEIVKAFTHTGTDHLKGSELNIPALLTDLEKNGVAVRDLGLDVHERKTLELILLIRTERLPDEHLPLPLKNWSVCIDNGYKIVHCPFEFAPHPLNYKTRTTQERVVEGFIR
jgi:hypothetical protein